MPDHTHASDKAQQAALFSANPTGTKCKLGLGRWLLRYTPGSVIISHLVSSLTLVLCATTKGFFLFLLNFANWALKTKGSEKAVSFSPLLFKTFISFFSFVSLCGILSICHAVWIHEYILNVCEWKKVLCFIYFLTTLVSSSKRFQWMFINSGNLISLLSLREKIYLYLLI